jgi:stearoyl-CoA desaturase (delta-9 desaturase)
LLFSPVQIPLAAAQIHPLSMSRIPVQRINWKTSIFLFGTLLLTITVVPLYVWKFGLDWFQVAFFLFMFAASAMSITLGYHRLFSHRAFAAHWTVRLATLLFGASAFENSALMWSSEHRRHHKHVDHDDDPYDISKGFFWAHIGWLLVKVDPTPPFDNVSDMKKDPLVMWQHKNIYLLGFVMGFIFPAAVGFAWGGPTGALGGFLLAGVARVVAVQHVTFFINSLCHTIGSRPYSSRCSARDSWIMAILTFGEGYHNYHHEFQHDYRNGVKPWQFDPTKWTIWLLSKLGLASQLRRVADDKIAAAQERERQRQQRLRAGIIEPEEEEIGPAALPDQAPS